MRHDLDFFVAYTTADRDRARPLAEALRARGHTVFIDVNGLAPGDAWPARLEAALDASTVVLVVASRASSWRSCCVPAAPWRRATSSSIPLPPPR